MSNVYTIQIFRRDEVPVKSYAFTTSFAIWTACNHDPTYGLNKHVDTLGNVFAFGNQYKLSEIIKKSSRYRIQPNIWQWLEEELFCIKSVCCY